MKIAAGFGNILVQVGRFAAPPVVLSLSVTSARVELKPLTIYRVWASVASFFLFGDVTVVATTNSHPLSAGVDVLLFTDHDSVYIAGIVSGGSGQMYISELSLDPY